MILSTLSYIAATEFSQQPNCSPAFVRTKIEGVRSGSSKVKVRPVMGLEGRNVQRMEARAA